MTFPQPRDGGRDVVEPGMSDRPGVNAASGADGAPPRLLPGVSAQAARRALLPMYVLLVGAYAALVAPSMSRDVAGIGGQLVWLVVALALTRATWVASRSTVAIERRFWGLVCGAGACLTASQVVYLLQTRALGTAPSLASLSTLLDAAAVLFLVAMMASLARFRRAMPAARARFVVDVLAACVVAVGLVDDQVVKSLYSTLSGSNAVAALLYSVYPVAGVLVLLGTLKVVIGTRSDRWKPWERYIAASASLLAVALIASPLVYSESAAELSRGWAVVVADASMLSALYLGFVAAVWRLAEWESPWRLRPLAIMEPSYGWMAAVVLPSIELLAIPAFGIAAFGTSEPSERVFRLSIVAIVAALLALRTLFAVADSEALLAKADTDPLTGLPNHRLFYDKLGSELERARRHGESVGVIALDIDDFSAVNSVGGHAAGDAAIVGIAKAVGDAVRVNDIACRVGGDEIMVILPGTDAVATMLTARRILDGVRGVLDPVGRMLTASAGVASFPNDAANRNDLVSRADSALYWAKRHGKDRAVVFDAHLVGPVNAQDRIRDIRQHANLDAVRSLAAAVDARDPGTQDHSRNVAALATALARDLGLDDQTVALIESAALLHDVGKIGVSDAVLHKTGPLGTEERALLLAHAPLGAEILSATAMPDILPWVRHHHERWDGTGSPDGLVGEDIPLGARIIALAEAYDSLVAGRAGRSPLPARAALQKIDLDLGVKFDPVVGERFITSQARKQPTAGDEKVTW